MPARKGLLAPQNTFLDTIATRFDGTHSNFVLGNAKIAKIPIVYCSDGFCELTGYSRAQIMQKPCACNFLYGAKTDVQHKDAIASALNSKQELKLELILYRSSGTPFWCLLDICGIQNESHEVVLFLCAFKDITKEKFHAQQRQLHDRQAYLAAHQPNAISGIDADHHLQQQQHHGEHSDEAQHVDANSIAEIGDPAASHKRQPSDGHQTVNFKDTLVAAEGQHAYDPTAADRLSYGGGPNPATDLTDEKALISMDEFGIEEGDESDEDHDKQTTNQYSRRRSRAVLYQLSGHYGGGPRAVSMKSKLKLNNRMTIPEYKTTGVTKERFILSHYGLAKSCWDWLILMVTFYVAIVVPYNAAFKDKQQVSTGDCDDMDVGDVIVEVVFVIDVILNFRTTFVNPKGEVVTKPKEICNHYVKSWFVVDACAALPFDLLCSLNIYKGSRLDLNLLKLIRLMRLARLLQKMDRYSQYSYIILTLLMLIFSLLAHWFACIWYVIALEEIKNNPPEWHISWIHQLSDKLGYNVVNSTSMTSSYITALYFTTSSLTSVGFGNVSANTNAEKIFSIVIMLIGALMHAVVFGNVTALIRVMYAKRSHYQTRLRDLKDLFRLHQIPKDLQQRMSDYFQTTWSLNHGVEISEILRDFPDELRGDVSLHLHREVLTLPIFETAPHGFLKSLARHIESKFCCPTEYLIHRGDALNYLYLVCNGSMEVLQEGMVVGILGKGDLVGYDVAAMVTPEHTQFGLSKMQMSAGLVKSSSDLKALTYCDLKCINIGGLLDVLKLYPEFSDTFHNEIMHDLSFNLREAPHDDGDDEDDDEDEDDDQDEDDDDDDDDDHIDGHAAHYDENETEEDHNDNDDHEALELPTSMSMGRRRRSGGGGGGGRLFRSNLRGDSRNNNGDAKAPTIGRYDHHDAEEEDETETETERRACGAKTAEEDNDLDQVEEENEAQEEEEDDDDNNDEEEDVEESESENEEEEEDDDDDNDESGGQPPSGGGGNAGSNGPGGSGSGIGGRADGSQVGSDHNGGHTDSKSAGGGTTAAAAAAATNPQRLTEPRDNLTSDNEILTSTSLDVELESDDENEDEESSDATGATISPQRRRKPLLLLRRRVGANSAAGRDTQSLRSSSLEGLLDEGGNQRAAATSGSTGGVGQTVELRELRSAMRSRVAADTTATSGDHPTIDQLGAGGLVKNFSDNILIGTRARLGDETGNGANAVAGGRGRRLRLQAATTSGPLVSSAQSPPSAMLPRSSALKSTGGDPSATGSMGSAAATTTSAASATPANRKPPLAFDLSRNTTAIVDRRRASAGCIPGKPALLAMASSGGLTKPSGPIQQQQQQPARLRQKLRGHSSLTHINEDQATGSIGRIGRPGSVLARTRPQTRGSATNGGIYFAAMNSPNANSRQWAGQQTVDPMSANGGHVVGGATSATFSIGPAPTNGRQSKLAKSQQQQQQQQQQQHQNQRPTTMTTRDAELKVIDEHISDVSASVRQMRRDMDEFRASIAALMQMVASDKSASGGNKKRQTPNMSKATTSKSSSTNRLTQLVTGNSVGGNGGGASASLACRQRRRVSLADKVGESLSPAQLSARVGGRAQSRAVARRSPSSSSLPADCVADSGQTSGSKLSGRRSSVKSRRLQAEQPTNGADCSAAAAAAAATVNAELIAEVVATIARRTSTSSNSSLTMAMATNSTVHRKDSQRRRLNSVGHSVGGDNNDDNREEALEFAAPPADPIAAANNNSAELVKKPPPQTDSEVGKLHTRQPQQLASSRLDQHTGRANQAPGVGRPASQCSGTEPMTHQLGANLNNRHSDCDDSGRSSSSVNSTSVNLTANPLGAAPVVSAASGATNWPPGAPLSSPTSSSSSGSATSQFSSSASMSATATCQPPSQMSATTKRQPKMLVTSARLDGGGSGGTMSYAIDMPTSEPLGGDYLRETK